MQLLLIILNYSELTNFNSPRKHQKIIGFLITSGGTEVNQIA